MTPAALVSRAVPGVLGLVPVPLRVREVQCPTEVPRILVDEHRPTATTLLTGLVLMPTEHLLVGVRAVEGHLHSLTRRATRVGRVSGFAPVVAWVLCAPKYLAGTMTLGELTQASAAFVIVQFAFNWLVDNYQRLSDWRSAVSRVATLLIALDEVTRLEHEKRDAQ